MVRNYVRNGHGWSQPNVTGADTQAGGRKLPKTPHGAKNAMAALQGMLGINQNNLTNMLGINGSVQNINNSISNVSGLMGGSMMSAAVRRLPQVPPLPAVGLPGQQQQQLLQQQQQQQPHQQSWISKLFHRKSATPQQETNQRLQQQLLLNQQQSNMNQQQILGGQQQQQQVGQHQHQYQQHQHPGPGYPPVITPAPLPMSASLSQLPANMNLVQQIQLPASNSLQPGGVVPHPPLPPPLHHLHHVQKKPGEGWGGRGAKLPKVPVPLPSLPPNKAYAGSHSFEEVEEDLFLDRIVAVGRGSRKLPNPADARPGRRLTRQNGIFKRGFSLDSDEYDLVCQNQVKTVCLQDKISTLFLQETF